MKKIFVITGEPGSGKSYITGFMEEKYGVNYLLQTTSRRIRVGEVDGHDFFFKEKIDIQYNFDKENWVQFGYQNSEFFGTNSHNLKNINTISLLPIEISDLIKQKNLDVTVIYLSSVDYDIRNRWLDNGFTESDIGERFFKERSIKEELIGLKIPFQIVEGGNKKTLKTLKKIIFSKLSMGERNVLRFSRFISFLREDI